MSSQIKITGAFGLRRGAVKGWLMNKAQTNCSDLAFRNEGAIFLHLMDN
jgi:hypothetical protein